MDWEDPNRKCIQKKMTTKDVPLRTTVGLCVTHYRIVYAIQRFLETLRRRVIQHTQRSIEMPRDSKPNPADTDIDIVTALL